MWQVDVLPIDLIYKDQRGQAQPLQNKKHEVEERSYMKIRAYLW